MAFQSQKQNKYLNEIFSLHNPLWWVYALITLFTLIAAIIIISHNAKMLTKQQLLGKKSEVKNFSFINNNPILDAQTRHMQTISADLEPVIYETRTSRPYQHLNVLEPHSLMIDYKNTLPPPEDQIIYKDPEPDFTSFSARGTDTVQNNTSGTRDDYTRVENE